MIDPLKHGMRLVEQAVCLASCVLLLVLVIGPSAAFAQSVSVRAELSAATITPDESVILTITATGISKELDASSLNKDFEVVGRSSSRQISAVIDSNNRAVNTSIVTWTLELLPKGKGVFTVPAVKVGDYETQLLTLTVNDGPAGAKRDVFVEASVDTTTPYVQSQVLMTLKVFQAIEIIDGGLDIPAADDLVVERIGDDKRSREVRDGREYSVTERRFAMFPQKSGPLSIGPITLSVTIPAEPNRVRGFFSPTRKLTRRSEPVELNVQARPPSGSAWWLPATNLTLSSQWQGDPTVAQVDQPLTRTLIMRAAGVLDSQLPEVNIPAIDGLSLYAEDPVLAMGGSESGLVAEQRINWALIPQRSGTLTLPAIKLEWFNTLTGQIETTELPEETIIVEAATATAAPAQTTTIAPNPSPLVKGNVGIDESLAQLKDSDAPATSANELINSNLPSFENGATVDGLNETLLRWQWLATAAIGLWFLTLVGWFFAHRRWALVGNNSVSDKTRRSAKVTAQGGGRSHKLAPMNAIEKACKQGDLLDIKRALLDWTANQWPDESLTTLDHLQSKLPEGAARDKISRLQDALYSQRGYALVMPTLTDDMASFPAGLKAALQQVDEESRAIDKGVSSRKSGSRLQPL